MKKTKNTGDNQYLPSCFFIKVDSMGITKKNFLSSSDFFHEYLHYIQDLSLPFMNFKYSYFSDVISILAEQAHNDITKRPFKKAKSEIQIINMQLFKYYFDLDKNSYCDYMDGDLLFPDKIQIGSINLTQKVFCFRNMNGDNIEYKISALDLIENMVAIIEEHFFGRQRIPDFPYRSMEFIIDSNYYDLNLSKYQISSLIELALYSLDPVSTLFSTLDRLLNDKLDIDTIDLKKFMFDGFIFLSPSEELSANSLDELKFKAMTTCLKSVSNLLGENILPKETLWVHSRIVRGFLKRNQEPTFISDLMINHNLNNKNVINFLLKMFDLPLVYINTGEVLTSKSSLCKSHGAISFYNCIVQTLYENLSRTTTKCILYETCIKLESDNKLKKGFVTDQCENDPMLRNYSGKKCVYTEYCKAKSIIKANG